MAPVLWALSPLVISELQNIPTFQLSGIVFLIAFLFTCFRLTKRREWHKIKPSMLILIIGFIAILNNQAAYVYAVKLIPPEQAEIIYYLWPVFAMIISGIFLENPRKIVPIFSALLGLASIYILITNGKGFGEISIERMEGYFFALIASASWVLYSLFSRYNPDIPKEMNGIWCGMAAIPCFLINCYCEDMIIPTLYEWVLMLFIGIGILSFSLNMWTTGLRYGHFNTLSVMSYMTPLVSVLILMIAGKADFQSHVILSCQLVILGACLCSIVDWVKKKIPSSDLTTE